jgi:hypothetical protein
LPGTFAASLSFMVSSATGGEPRQHVSHVLHRDAATGIEHAEKQGQTESSR